MKECWELFWERRCSSARYYQRLLPPINTGVNTAPPDRARTATCTPTRNPAHHVATWRLNITIPQHRTRDMPHSPPRQTMNLPIVSIEPAAPHTHTVVFLHGRGDTAYNFTTSLDRACDSSGRNLTDAFPSIRWVFPQAPTRKCASSPNTWPQWFDVWNVGNFAENEELQAIGLRDVLPHVRRVVAGEAVILGGRWDRVILAGISMGAATSVHLLFNLDVPGERGLGAFMGFSCRCPFAGRSLAGMRSVLGVEGAPEHNAVLRNTPMLLEHCVDDPLVLVESGRGLRDTLRGFGARVEWREYPSGGHWFNSPAGIDDAVAFLNEVMARGTGRGSSGEQASPEQVLPGDMDLS